MSKQPIIIGISGPSASGKSLLANTIVNELGSQQVVVISEDAYYKDNSHLPFAEREKINYDHPDAFDHALLCEHLKLLRRGESVNIPIYSHSKHLRLPETRSVGRHAIIVLEGILLFSDKALREIMDIRIFMSTPLDVCLTRRLKRDVVERHRSFESVVHQYETTVRPMYLQFIEPSSRYADIIVPRGGENRIAIDMIQAKMRELLAMHNNE
ncbi:uridine kinase [Legionella quinlivanii]|uniref:Uridine kinase n=1 Tax=Legionella quinlivanii TaxID=45073 RepID=A0A0W0Y119_9GAMM|nr:MULTISPECIES: uridine kinase [Legionella]KTD50227.1 uridine kinase [Legionella quinlivanii]MCE3045928.1 uridine kinase [Legionella sp. 16cNR16C]MCW8450029.1 uridine kinase [Legionella quinlivanii]SEF46758.1 uridine kinase [Legionella quinlivanii DSM 21216]STY11825.1 uridine kinase [Legionella quinlivanii]